MEQQIHFCTTEDGVRIAYATVGEGPPLVKAANWLSHLEFDWRSPVWRHLLAEFARDHTFIRYDERGNGLSDWNVADLSFEAWVKDLESVVDAAGVDRFPLLGISQGGAVAIAYAVRHPEKVSHLILYGAYARGWARRDSPEEIEQRQAALTLVRLGWGKDNPAFRQLWTSLYAPDATPEQAQSFNDLQRVSTSPENAVKLMNIMSNIDVMDLLPQVKVPTLVLHCRDEAGVPFEEGRKLAGTIPGALFVPVNGRNHLLLEGDPSWDTFVKEVRHFLGTVETGALKQSSGSAKLAKPDLKRSDLPDRYTIISFLGVGGMGEVYLAEDTKLGRKVALKTLPAEFTNDKERLRRFQQEARAASALNHPNLLTIHEIGAESGAHFIAAEYIDGETLRTRLKRERMKIDDALDVAQQAAFALTAAHDAGIVHRDIKPENIMVRRDGIVKVLDFGLAKLLEDHAREMIDHEADTRALVLTDPGRVLGTPAYMSPEQARGFDLDARTDIWSLGVVLYEMVAGRAPFRGETKSHTVVSILESEPPPLATFAPDAPAELQRIVRKALSKDPDSRYQTARDLMIDLKSLRRDLDIQSELSRSSAPGPRVSEADITPEFVTSNTEVGLSEHPTSLAETRPTSSDTQSGEGSVRYRIAALIAMLLLAVASLGVWYYFHRQSPGSAIGSIESMAVMPFVNASNDPNSDYFSDGVTESIINSLSQLPQKKILARATVFRYKGLDLDLQKVGRELGVDALLTGRVTQQGDTLTIQADLVRVADGSELWGGRYNRKLADIFAVQSEIANEISETLRLKLNNDEQKRVTRRYTDNVEAYQLYLKGQFEANKFTPEGLQKGIEYFNQAIAVDPAYALTYAGLADLYITQAHVWVTPREGYTKAKWAAEKALQLDNTLAEAHKTVGLVKLYYDWDFSAAEKEFKLAIELNPNFSDAHSAYSCYFKAMRRYPEEITEAKRGQELDPLSAFTNMELGEAFYMARRYDEAIEQIRKSLELDPHFFIAYHVRLRAYEKKTMYAEAIADCQEWLKVFHDDPQALASLGHVYGAMGKRREAEEILNKLQGISKQRYFSPYWIALVYAGLGDNDHAFQYFEKALEDRFFLMIWINSDPRLDNLRTDPRFTGLARRVGLL
jgi:serine/threonine protein kinase/pimeloyl-ACP methyl ester carboxylesterase/tetratricopeptide (TPR) repeat protein